MRKEKALIVLFRSLVDLIQEEASRNPMFEQKLNNLLSEVPGAKSPTAKKRPAPISETTLPDVYAKWDELGEEEFRFWLKDQAIDVMRALIRRHDFDAARRTVKWKDREKLSAYIADQLRSRM